MLSVCAQLLVVWELTVHPLCVPSCPWQELAVHTEQAVQDPN